jgi:hypothetical protein
VPTKVIRVAPRRLGWNTSLTDGFMLGTPPGGGYGIIWHRGPDGLGHRMYWLPWEPPHDPVRIEFEGQEFVVCQDTASEAAINTAPRKEFEQSMEGR